MFAKINRQLKTIINKWIIYPYKAYQRKKNANKFARNVKRQFKKDFKLDPNFIRSIMVRADATSSMSLGRTPVVMTYEEHKKFLSAQLSENAKIINSLSSKPAFFYEPEIVDIHNEDIYARVGPSLKKIIADESIIDKNILNAQAPLPPRGLDKKYLVDNSKYHTIKQETRYSPDITVDAIVKGMMERAKKTP